MKVYLLNPPYLPGFTGRDARWQDASRAGTTYYPIWLAYATGLLEQAGHEARLVDADVWGWSRERLLEDMRAFRPDLVVVNTSSPSLASDILVAEAIKQALPSVKTVMVGAPTALFPDRMLASPGVDFVARREYDLTLRELAETMASGGYQTVSGISYKEDGQIVHHPDRAFTTSADLDGMPFVSQVYRRHLNIGDYFLNYSLYPMVQVFGGRGCPFRCTFCCWPQTFMGRQHRMRSPDNVVDEMAWVVQNLPQVKAVFFEDDTFTVNKKWVLAFTGAYRERGLKLPWACQARADLDYETMRAMRQANCLTVVVGFESGDDTLLQNVKKGITVAGSRQFIGDAARAGMPVHGNFMVGLPGETRETIEKTRKLALESKSVAITVEAATPFPGTEFYDWVKRQGYLLVDDPKDYLDERGIQRIIITYPGLSEKEIGRAVDRILKGYFLSPRYLPIALKRLLHRYGWQELKVLLRSTRMFLRYYFGR